MTAPGTADRVLVLLFFFLHRRRGGWSGLRKEKGEATWAAVARGRSTIRPRPHSLSLDLHSGSTSEECGKKIRDLAKANALIAYPGVKGPGCLP